MVADLGQDRRTDLAMTPFVFGFSRWWPGTELERCSCMMSSSVGGVSIVRYGPLNTGSDEGVAAWVLGGRE